MIRTTYSNRYMVGGLISGAVLFCPTDKYIIHQPTKPAVQKTLRAMYYCFVFVSVYARGFED